MGFGIGARYSRSDVIGQHLSYYLRLPFRNPTHAQILGLRHPLHALGATERLDLWSLTHRGSLQSTPTLRQ